MASGIAIFPTAARSGGARSHHPTGAGSAAPRWPASTSPTPARQRGPSGTDRSTSWRCDPPTSCLVTLWRFEVDVDEIADVRGEAQLARVGLAVPLPRRHGWPAFQKIGEQLHTEGWKGVRAMSAAKPGSGEILCLFRESERIDGTKALPPPAIQRNPPPRPAA
jgi:hypothetical protein